MASMVVLDGYRQILLISSRVLVIEMINYESGFGFEIFHQRISDLVTCKLIEFNTSFIV